MRSSKEDDNKTTTSVLLKPTLSALSRALMAVPGDNLAKRMQVYPDPIKFKTISQLLFQDATGFGKLTNAYKGIGISLFYKGFQAYAFDKTFDYQKDFETKFGKSKLNTAAFSLASAAVQTLILHPVSTVRTRFQVNNPEFLKVNNQNIPSYLRDSRFFGAIYQGNFFNGFKESLARNSIFSLASNSVYSTYRDTIIKNHILGDDSTKSNTKQEVLARIMSGSTGVTASILFDNVKTLKQVNAKYENHSTIHIISDSLKTKGIFRTIRPGAPYIVSESLGLIGFYAGKSLASYIEEKNQQHSL